MAEAKVAGIKAGETAGDALVRAAALEKEAARLTKEAEEAKLETERLKAQTEWRRLSPDQRKMIVDDLSGKTLQYISTIRKTIPKRCNFRRTCLRR